MNAAEQLTPEQQRERLLKRLLPALVIVVVYFVFISKGVAEKAEQAEQAYLALASRGISEAALPGISRQQQQMEQEIRRLEAEHEKIHSSLKETTGRLGREETAIQALEKVSAVLAENDLRITETTPDAVSSGNALTQSAKDIGHWLKESVDDADKLTVWRIHFIGAYQSVYNALRAIMTEDFPGIPLALSMAEAGEEAERENDLSWTLLVWI